MTFEDYLTPAAEMLNEAAMERDWEMARTVIRNCTSKMGTAALLLESIYHPAAVADYADWAWMAEHLI